MARLPPIMNPETLTISFPGWRASDDCSPRREVIEMKIGMSAFGTSRKCHLRRAKAAYGSKADSGKPPLPFDPLTSSGLRVACSGMKGFWLCTLYFASS